MEGRRYQDVSRRLPRFIAAAALIPLGAAILAVPASASGPGDDGSAGWFDPYDPGRYHVRARQPGRPAAQPASGAHTGGTGSTMSGDGCTVDGSMMLCPKCADPAGTGICNSPAVPVITPAQLAQQSWNSLELPLPDARTAPPRGAQGLVGLPEWVWVPRGQWRPLSKQATAGGVWAQVTATPKQMTITPGAGLPTVSCAGPGTAYDPNRPASVQQTDCSYTYRTSSATQPGGAYQVTVTVVWGGSWTGSGGAGGTLPAISRSTTFALRVAEGQGLYG